MLKMTFSNIYYWYKIYERQMAEEIIIDEYRNKKKPMPSSTTMHRMIDNKIKSWHDSEV